MYSRKSECSDISLARYAEIPPEKRGKRFFDIAIVLIAAPLALPLLAVLWVLARQDGGPGFFGHDRVGRNGRMFRCWKIRTMVPNAEQRLMEHLEANPRAAMEWAESFKLKDDPRITPVGRFLRRTSLDELPQLWNVLRGEMSVVGPRPVRLDELDMYSSHVDAYLRLTPGITGLWQVSGRNTLSYQQRVAFDMEYGRRRSLGFDAWIVARTAVVMLQRNGL